MNPQGSNGARMHDGRQWIWRLRLVVKKDALGEREKPFALKYIPFIGRKNHIRELKAPLHWKTVGFELQMVSL